VLLVAAVAAHACLLLLSDALEPVTGSCATVVRLWVLVLAVGGASAWGLVAIATLAVWRGRRLGVAIAGAAVVAYTCWGWLGVASGAAEALPGCPATVGHVVMGFGIAAGVLGTSAIVGALLWHRATRRHDQDASCRGCCNLGACIVPCTSVEATKDVLCCFCCRCQIATTLPPPPPKDLMASLSRKRFEHAEACLPCAEQVRDPEHMGLRVYGGEERARAMREFRMTELERVNRARRLAGLAPVELDDDARTGASLPVAKRVSSDARSPGRAMKAAAAVAAGGGASRHAPATDTASTSSGEPSEVASLADLA